MQVKFSVLFGVFVVLSGFVSADIYDNVELISNTENCGGDRICEAVFKLDLTGMDTQLSKDFLQLSFENKKGDLIQESFTTNIDIGYPSTITRYDETLTDCVNSNLTNGSKTIVCDKVVTPIYEEHIDYGKTHLQSGINYVRLWSSSKPTNLWVDWHILIPEISFAGKTSSFDTHVKGWAIWGNESGGYYWIEDSSHDLWVMVNLTANEQVTLYVNKTSGFEPDGNRTFLFFDDFSASSTYEVKYPRGSTGDCTISSGYLRINPSGDTTVVCLKDTGIASNDTNFEMQGRVDYNPTSTANWGGPVSRFNRVTGGSNSGLYCLSYVQYVVSPDDLYVVCDTGPAGYNVESTSSDMSNDQLHKIGLMDNGYTLTSWGVDGTSES